jgi:hypothetical protein
MRVRGASTAGECVRQRKQTKSYAQDPSDDDSAQADTTTGHRTIPFGFVRPEPRPARHVGGAMV